jgi:hypothetical protein
MTEENMTPETEVNASPVSTGDDMMPRSEAENLLKALKAEREARKQYERDLKETKGQLERFSEINPEEYTKLQAEAAEAAKVQAQFGEQRELIEQKYSRQAEEAAREAAAAKSALQDYQKKYALEKVFYSAGGRTDAADGVSFFDMMAQQIGGNFRQEPDGSLTVVDAGGDPVLDKESGKRISVDDYISAYKSHPIYGTFFKGSKGAGAGIGYGGTDANGVVSQDFSSLTPDQMFQEAFK